jgi:hypothetical protein
MGLRLSRMLGVRADHAKCVQDAVGWWRAETAAGGEPAQARAFERPPFVRKPAGNGARASDASSATVRAVVILSGRSRGNSVSPLPFATGRRTRRSLPPPKLFSHPTSVNGLPAPASPCVRS